MTITTVSIACDVGLPNNTEFTAARLDFTLSGPDYDTASNDSIPAATVIVALDAAGAGMALLWPVDRGTRNTFYSVVLHGSRTVNGRAVSETLTLGRIQPQSAGGADLANLLAQSSGGIVVGSTIYDTIADAVAAALEAAAAGADPIAAIAARDAAESAADRAEAAAISAAAFATNEPFSGVTVAGVADYPLPYNPMAAEFVRLHVGGVPQEPGAGFTLVAMPSEPSGWGFRLTFPVIDGIEFWGFVQRPIAAEATDPTFRFPDGVVSAPGFAFAADLDTGIRRTGTNALAVVTGGADRLAVNAGGAVLTGLLSGTAVTQTPVDATAGRVLKVGDFGIGIVGDAQALALRIADGTVDLPSGFFSGPGSSGVNYPTSATRFNPFINLSRNVGGGNYIQTRVFFSDRIPIIGSKSTGGSWAYATAFTTDNLVGPVSQTAGVPTGAVIQRGSNANGDFTRFADGTMICTRSIAASSGAATTWTFPSPFAAAPHVTGTAIATVLSAVCLDAAPTTTAATFSARDKADARRADTCHLIARGRWF